MTAKRKAKAVTLRQPPANWDQGATGPANQDGLRTETATEFDPNTGKESPNPNGVMRRRRDNWVKRYERAGHLTRSQTSIAERLRMASEGMREKDPLAALRIDRLHGQSDPEASRVDARRYFLSLWASVPISSRPVIERVVIEDHPIWHGNSVQRARHMQRLRDGLDAIA